jgi:hypothetical protein
MGWTVRGALSGTFGSALFLLTAHLYRRHHISRATRDGPHILNAGSGHFSG